MDDKNKPAEIKSLGAQPVIKEAAKPKLTEFGLTEERQATLAQHYALTPSKQELYNHFKERAAGKEAGSDEAKEFKFLDTLSLRMAR